MPFSPPAERPAAPPGGPPRFPLGGALFTPAESPAAIKAADEAAAFTPHPQSKGRHRSIVWQEIHIHDCRMAALDIRTMHASDRTPLARILPRVMGGPV